MSAGRHRALTILRPSSKASNTEITVVSGWPFVHEAQGSRRAARQLRDVLRERLRGELDPFRERQVRVEGRGEILDRQPELDREGRLRDHLTGFGGNDVGTDDLLGTSIRYQLDESPRVPRRERPRHVLERQLGDERLDSLSSCLVLSQADGGDRGVGEG